MTTDHEEIYGLRHEEKLTLQAIADLKGVSRQRVHQILGNTGGIGLQFRLECDTNGILQLDTNGFTRHQIAEMTHHSYQHICDVLTKHGRHKITNRHLFSQGLRKCHGLCKQTLPLDDFGPNKSMPDGKMSVCKVCNRERARMYRNG